MKKLNNEKLNIERELNNLFLIFIENEKYILEIKNKENLYLGEKVGEIINLKFENEKISKRINTILKENPEIEKKYLFYLNAVEFNKEI